MTPHVQLTITSLLSILFMTFHLTDDVLFKRSPAGLENAFAVFILAVWLYGTLALAHRPAGYLIMLAGSVFGLAVPVIHMRGADGVLGGGIGESSAAFRFVWTLLALGMTAMFSGVLSSRAVWNLLWRPPHGDPQAGARP